MLADDDALNRGNEWPTYCYWVGAQILRLDGRSTEAASLLERAKRLMQKSANALAEEDRVSFLALPWHADIKNTAATGIWPDPPR